MKKLISLLLLFLPGTRLCHAQQVLYKLRYQLVESILSELPPQFTYARLGPNGKYQRLRPMVTDTPTVGLRMLDHVHLGDDDYRLVLAAEGTQEETALLKYFSRADLVYMRQQVPSSENFGFEQAKILEPWVKVVPLDTVMAMNKRLSWQARTLGRDLLFERYGTDNTLTIWSVLFSKNHQRALVNVGSEGWETSVYIKQGATWRREASLMMVEY